jgi:PilZ domain
MPAGSDWREERMVPPIANKRSTTRRRTLLGGTVVISEGRHSFNCTIRDISDNGARIRLAVGQAVPKEFSLIVVRDQVAHQSTLCWAKGTEAGVSYRSTVVFKKPTVTDPHYLERFMLTRTVGNDWAA